MKGRWKSVVALLLVGILVCMAPGGNRAARAIDWDKDISLTVDPGRKQMPEIDEANVVLDVYKIADAAPIEGYDIYDYTLVAPYDTLELPLPADRNNDTWTAFAQAAANIALTGENELVTEGADVNLAIEGLDAGLYLVIARGADVEDYVTTIEGENGQESLVTIASSNQYNYLFSPALVSLPNKEEDEDGIINTANPGEWIYDATITLKPDRTQRYGSLEIIKYLTEYVPGKAATFEFQVEAVLNGKSVYSDSVTIDIKEGEPLHKSVLIENIPVGAEVTITETYQGVVYKSVVGDDTTKNVTIQVGDPSVVEFVNEPSGSTNNGGSITNEFVFDEDSNRWVWTPIVNHP